MGLGARDVAGIEPPVEIDRGVDALHDGGRSGLEPAAPQGVGLAFRRRLSGAERPCPGLGLGFAGHDAYGAVVRNKDAAVRIRIQSWIVALLSLGLIGAASVLSPPPQAGA